MPAEMQVVPGLATLYVGQSLNVNARLRDGERAHRMWTDVVASLKWGWVGGGCIAVWSVHGHIGDDARGAIGTVEAELKRLLQPESDSERFDLGAVPGASWRYREPDDVISFSDACHGSWGAGWSDGPGCYAWLCSDIDGWRRAATRATRAAADRVRIPYVSRGAPSLSLTSA